jgi:hypothetical protein
MPSPPVVGLLGGQPPTGPPGALGGFPHESIPYHLTTRPFTISHKSKNSRGWGGTIPDQLAMYLWTRLVDVKSLNIRTWITSQEGGTKAYMRAHWTNYCTIICDKWLGPNWQEECNHEYVNMRFRMQGRADETLKEFIQRCILYARTCTLGCSLIMNGAPRQKSGTFSIPPLPHGLLF